MLTRGVIAPAVVLFMFASSSLALAIFPRFAMCGRVTSFVSAPPPADQIVRLGTQEPRRLSLGIADLQVGQEVCIWGYDVENKNPPAGDPAPKGITGYAIAPVASIGCAKVTDTTATWVMPRESNGLANQLPDMAFLALPLSKPAGDGCVRIAVDKQGNPIAVVVPRAATSSPAVSTSPPRPSVASLPSTNASDDRGSLVLVLLGAGAFIAAAGVLARRRSREIPS